MWCAVVHRSVLSSHVIYGAIRCASKSNSLIAPHSPSTVSPSNPRVLCRVCAVCCVQSTEELRWEDYADGRHGTSVNAIAALIASFVPDLFTEPLHPLT